jgi:hypothetical protein
MSDLAKPCHVADGINYVVRRFALRLVNDKGAVEWSGLRFAGHEEVSLR